MGASLNRGKNGVVALAAVTLAAERTSEAFTVQGYNTVTLHVDYTRSAGTDVFINIDQSDDNGTTWRQTVIGTKTAGVVEVAELALTETGTASFAYTFPPVAIDCTDIRIRADATAGAAGDILTVKMSYCAHNSSTVL